MNYPDPAITLKDGPWGGRALRFASIDSTNSWAISNPDRCAHGDVIIAENQTAGRGRFNRSWLSLPHKSLTLSVILDSTRLTPLPPENYAQIIAVAVWNVLNKLRISSTLKWPNDIMTGSGKICGILAESISDTMLVAGIGINTALENSDITLYSQARPCSSMHIEGVIPPDDAVLIAMLSASIESTFNTCMQSGMTSLWETWSLNDYLENRQITIQGPNDLIHGKYAGISKEGRLLIRFGGSTREFSSGDVTLS